MKQTTIIYGPQGCGKSLHAQAFARHFGADAVVDDWDGASDLEPGSLALTQCALGELPRFFSHSGEAINLLSFEFAQALTGVGTSAIACTCGNHGCDGVMYRPPYARNFALCSVFHAKLRALPRGVLIIYGRQGCGKTTYAEKFAQHFGKTEIIDDWNGRTPLGPESMALCSFPLDGVSSPDGAVAIDFDAALRMAGLVTPE